MSLNANTTDACADCGAKGVVTVKQAVQFGGQWFVWALCVPCRREEMRRGEES